MHFWWMSLSARRSFARQFRWQGTDDELGESETWKIEDRVPRLRILRPVYGSVLVRDAHCEKTVTAHVFSAAPEKQAVEDLKSAIIDGPTTLTHAGWSRMGR
jgi:hypothetical protein